MKNFKYKAKKGPHETVEGMIVALSRDEAVDKINEMGFFPIDVREDRTGTAAKSPLSFFRFPQVKSVEVITFYRQLARLAKSGLPILQALSLVKDHAQQASAKKIFETIQLSVRQGYSLSEALQAFPGVFSSFDIAMIQAGENAGRLDEALTKVVRYRLEQRELISKVRMAVIYPCFIVLMGLLTMIFMLSFVIPRYVLFFKDLGQNLPLLTRILIALSQGTQQYGIWIFLTFLVLYAVIINLVRQPSNRLKLDRALLKVPKLGNFFLKTEIIRLARTLALLLKSGVPILNALRITLPVIGNTMIKREAQFCYELLEEGKNLSDGLKQSKVFPPLMIQMITLGEESGRLDEVLIEIADWYEQETMEAVQLGTRLLEPLMILGVGLMLGFMIIAVLLPVFSMNAVVAS